MYIVILLVRIDSHKCIIDQDKLDSCAKGLTFFSIERKHFPSTNHQLDKYCKIKSESIQCLKQYVHSCLTMDEFQRQYVKKYVSNYRKQLDHTCLHITERESECLYITVYLLIAVGFIYVHI